MTYRLLGQVDPVTVPPSPVNWPTILGWTAVVGVAVAIFNGTINLRTNRRRRSKKVGRNSHRGSGSTYRDVRTLKVGALVGTRAHPRFDITLEERTDSSTSHARYHVSVFDRRTNHSWGMDFSKLSLAEDYMDDQALGLSKVDDSWNPRNHPVPNGRRQSKRERAYALNHPEASPEEVRAVVAASRAPKPWRRGHSPAQVAARATSKKVRANGYRGPGFKRPPRVGTRVVFDPNPASLALYSGQHPALGERGTVSTVAMPGGKASFMHGPGGGLVYVDWDESRFQGVSLNDLSKA